MGKRLSFWRPLRGICTTKNSTDWCCGGELRRYLQKP
jgi:hypothetical protein